MTVGQEDRTSVFKVLRYTPTGLLRWLWLRFTGKEIAVTGECLKCGRCCRRLNLSYADRWIRKEKDFTRMLRDYPEYERFHMTGTTSAGLLVFECDKISPEGLCSEHEGRPDICRDYPEKDLVFTGGELLEHCGYSFLEAPSFRKMLEREAKAVNPEP